MSLQFWAETDQPALWDKWSPPRMDFVPNGQWWETWAFGPPNDTGGKICGYVLLGRDAMTRNDALMVIKNKLRLEDRTQIEGVARFTQAEIDAAFA